MSLNRLLKGEISVYIYFFFLYKYQINVCNKDAEVVSFDKKKIGNAFITMDQTKRIKLRLLKDLLIIEHHDRSIYPY